MSIENPFYSAFLVVARSASSVLRRKKDDLGTT